MPNRWSWKPWLEQSAAAQRDALAALAADDQLRPPSRTLSPSADPGPTPWTT